MKNLLASKKFYLASSEEIPCKGGRLVGYKKISTQEMSSALKA